MNYTRKNLIDVLEVVLKQKYPLFKSKKKTFSFFNLSIFLQYIVYYECDIYELHNIRLVLFLTIINFLNNISKKYNTNIVQVIGVWIHKTL